MPGHKAINSNFAGALGKGVVSSTPDKCVRGYGCDPLKVRMLSMINPT